MANRALLSQDVSGSAGAKERLVHTCARHSEPWLPPAGCCSESERCPGSDPGERSVEGHAACK